jgi:hypothetical protein
MILTHESVASLGGMVALWEAWWLSGSTPDCCPAVPGSNPRLPSPQLTANLLAGCHLGWHLAGG